MEKYLTIWNRFDVICSSTKLHTYFKFYEYLLEAQSTKVNCFLMTQSLCATTNNFVCSIFLWCLVTFNSHSSNFRIHIFSFLSYYLLNLTAIALWRRQRTLKNSIQRPQITHQMQYLLFSTIIYAKRANQANKKTKESKNE